ncbi:hypothetical protein, partial [Rhodoferax sp.]|uniref:hypothetical protein n=1 Tax=Rhodoferax sp. TaxID=50421 RepID=UPI003BB7ACD6
MLNAALLRVLQKGEIERLDRGREGLSLPSLRTVRAVLPHTALQLVVSSSGLALQYVSLSH